MVYQKGLYDRGNAFPDKVLLLVYPFSVCTMQCLYSPLCALWIKKLSWLRQNTLPAPHDPAINCVPVHRFLSPGCARLLSEWLKWCGGRTVKKWFATLIDDLKFLGAECKREFSDLDITPASEVPENLSRPKKAYVPFNVYVPSTNIQFYRRRR
ncbi:hypothetical protein [Escherichia coli]|uniref:hypothetical protein n=3 Tax=Escherichia coli TaxID=562 RepID=UPI00202E1D23|nr:hypothetical protein [Escherichia coli]